MVDAVTRRLVTLALEEDVGPGDVTGPSVIPNKAGRAEFVAKSELVFSGRAVCQEVFRQVDPRVAVHFSFDEGAHVSPQTVLGFVEGNAQSLLVAERTALNFLQRLCGIATVTQAAAHAVQGTRTRVVDTRKTTPGMRVLEKAAVRAGGGKNHRFGLFDGVLIKDNHIAAAGSVTVAVNAVRKKAHHLLRIECETTNLAEVDEALEVGVDVILLDNMDLETMRQAVDKIAGRAQTEASGNVTLERLSGIAATGVDFISMGALTHSAPAADVSLRWTR